MQDFKENQSNFWLGDKVCIILNGEERKVFINRFYDNRKVRVGEKFEPTNLASVTYLIDESSIKAVESRGNFYKFRNAGKIEFSDPTEEAFFRYVTGSAARVGERSDDLDSIIEKIKKNQIHSFFKVTELVGGQIVSHYCGVELTDKVNIGKPLAKETLEKYKRNNGFLGKIFKKPSQS